MYPDHLLNPNQALHGTLMSRFRTLHSSPIKRLQWQQEKLKLAGPMSSGEISALLRGDGEEEEEDEEYPACGFVRDLPLAFQAVSETLHHFLGLDLDLDGFPDGTKTGFKVTLMWWSLPEWYHSTRLQHTVNIELKGLCFEQPYDRKKPADDYDGGGFFLANGE